MEVEDLSKETAERFVISAANLDIKERHRVLTDQFKAMVDQGANINLGPVRLARRWAWRLCHIRMDER